MLMQKMSLLVRMLPSAHYPHRVLVNLKLPTASMPISMQLCCGNKDLKGPHNSVLVLLVSEKRFFLNHKQIFVSAMAVAQR